jgi:hypothetical protein
VASQALWLQEHVEPLMSELPKWLQLTRLQAAIESAIMGGVVIAALATRYPGVEQPIRDASLGGTLGLAGFYAVLTVSRERPTLALRWVVTWCACLVVLYLERALDTDPDCRGTASRRPTYAHICLGSICLPGGS